MTRDELRALHCDFPHVDRCAGDSETTDWKRRARLHQARWRASRGYPIGVHPRTGAPHGTRLARKYAEGSGANFLSDQVRQAVRYRIDKREKYETFDDDRLWCDLLSSMPLCFNLFGDLWADSDGLARALTEWWPDAPGGPVRLRFEHSPGRWDREYLNNRSAFDAAFYVTQDDGEEAVIGIETKYHEHPVPGAIPKPNRLPRYVEVTERSRIFVPDWQDKLLGTDLQQIWLDHLLVLAMLQHPSGRWNWGRFVLVYPANNLSFARLADQYGEALLDSATYEARTIESLLDTPGALDTSFIATFRERYLP